MSTIKELQKTIHHDNCARGWWDDVELPLRVMAERSRLTATEKLMLVVSECSEALEEIREGHPLDEVRIGDGGKPLGFPTEIADAVIRLLDLADACNIDLEAVIDQKLAYNRTRGFRHGGKLA